MLQQELSEVPRVQEALRVYLEASDVLWEPLGQRPEALLPSRLREP
ncbi:hypothetical protein [Streptomyces sp. NPDC059788]